MNWKAQDFDKETVQNLTCYTGLHNFVPDYSKKRFVVQTDTELSLLKLARQGGKPYDIYIEITKNDYVMISHIRGYSIFMRRTEYHPERVEGFQYLKRYYNLIYTLTNPPVKKRSTELPNRLLVLFSHMNGGDGYDSNNALERQFVQFFDSVQRSLVKNVYVLRIADTNLSHGSYFVNTENFSDYEDKIQSLIARIAKNKNIASNDVVLYGGSKGGAGALLHGALGNYHAVAGDPIINAKLYNNNKDWHFIKQFREEDLTDKILSLSAGNDRDMYVFGSSNAHKFNYTHSAEISKKSGGLISLVDLSDDKTIKSHPHVTAHSVPEQITLINLMFDGAKILGRSKAN